MNPTGISEYQIKHVLLKIEIWELKHSLSWVEFQSSTPLWELPQAANIHPKAELPKKRGLAHTVEFSSMLRWRNQFIFLLSFFSLLLFFGGRSMPPRQHNTLGIIMPRCSAHSPFDQRPWRTFLRPRRARARWWLLQHSSCSCVIFDFFFSFLLLCGFVSLSARVRPSLFEFSFDFLVLQGHFGGGKMSAKFWFLH